MIKAANLIKFAPESKDDSNTNGINTKKQITKNGGTINNNVFINNYYEKALEKFASDETDNSKIKYMLGIIKESQNKN